MPLVRVVAAVVLVLVVSACGGRDSPEPQVSGKVSLAVPSPTASPYRPLIDPGSFTHRVTNPYFPLPAGTRWQYRGVGDGVPLRSVVTVTDRTRTVMGVRCVVVSDVVRTADGTLVEVTDDWYAQDRAGTVWYFGESTREYEGGKPATTAGSWTAGVRGAQAGIAMPAKPRIGMAYRQEYARGAAEDAGRVIGVDAMVRVPYGTFRNVLVTQDTNALDPGVIEHKWYARGVGLLRSEIQHGTPRDVDELVSVMRR
jgi:hypothetical protein